MSSENETTSKVFSADLTLQVKQHHGVLGAVAPTVVEVECEQGLEFACILGDFHNIVES